MGRYVRCPLCSRMCPCLMLVSQMIFPKVFISLGIRIFMSIQPVVLDLMDCDLWAELPKVFDAVQPGLLDVIMDK